MHEMQPSLIKGWSEWRSISLTYVSIDSIFGYLFNVTVIILVIIHNAMHTHKKNQLRAAISHAQTHTHCITPYVMILSHTSDSTYVSTKKFTAILANCRHPGVCFGLLALISAVQPSKSPTRLLNPVQFTNTHWTMQPHISGLPSNAHTIPTCKKINAIATFNWPFLLCY